MIDSRIRYFYRTFYRIPFLVPYWGHAELAAIRHALRPNRGERVAPARAALERALAELGFPHVVLTSTGRFALEVGLRRLGRPGSEVIVPAFACRAIARAVLRAGRVPVFADVNADLTLSAESVRTRLTPATAAVVVAHLSGKPAADFDELLELCRVHGLALIDDAAQALGVSHGGRPLGSFGALGLLSFGLGKPTFSLGGGALVVPSAAVKAECEALARMLDEGAPSRLCELALVGRFLLEYRYRHRTQPFFLAWHFIGKALARRRSRERHGCITALEAELQLIQLGKLPRIVGRFRDNGRRLAGAFASSGVVTVPQTSDDCAYTKVLVQTPAGRARRVAEHLLTKGIEIEWSYRPLDQAPEFGKFRRAPNPETERVWPDLFSVPNHPGLTMDELDYVAAAVAEAT